MTTLTVALIAALFMPVAPSADAPRTVTRAEYQKVEGGMSRARVERIFDAGRGCAYTSYTSGDALFTGRQYRNAVGSRVSIRYVVRADGVERVRGRQWDTATVC